MILESVTLENIRSYLAPTTVPLPTGITLFEGDIGSGKSSILSAIEFALFGLGDVDGRHLLNSRATRGSVSLEFRVGDTKYKVYRELVRHKKNVIQGDGYVFEGGTRTSYSVNEMRGRILDIIGIKERPQARTTSLIYRSAVFSPQEMMKEILTQPQDRRLDTLRRAFGIEEYSNAKRNTDIVHSWATGETRVAVGLSSNLSKRRKELAEEEEKKGQRSSEAEAIGSELKGMEAELQAVDQKVAAMKEHRDRILQLETSIPMLQNNVRTASESLVEERRRLSKLREELSEIQKTEKQIGDLGQRYGAFVLEKQELEPLEKLAEEHAANESERQRLRITINEKGANLQSEISNLEAEVANEESELKKDLEQVGPLERLVARRAELAKSAPQVSVLSRRREQLKSTSEKVKLEIAPLAEELRQARDEIQSLVKIGVGAPCPKCKQALSEQHLKQLKKEYTVAASRKRKKLTDLKTRLAEAVKETKAREAELQEAQKAEKELHSIDPEISTLKERASAARKAESRLAGKKGRLAGMVEILRRKDFEQSERKELGAVEELLREKATSMARYRELKKSVQAAEKAQLQSIYLQSEQRMSRKPQLEDEMRSREQAASAAEATLSKLRLELEDKEGSYARDKPVLKELTILEKQRVESSAKRDEHVRKLARITATLDAAKERIMEISEDVRRMEGADRRKVYYEVFGGWLDDAFVPAVQEIEKHTLATVNEQFNLEFQKWFTVLIETGDMDVEVDESFTPMVTQGGYSLDVNGLSGGEKTSVALAYRLALNVTARAVMGFQPDLLILDEPTDGFSSVQLTKLNQVLEGLNASQVIMVSHERELETYADHIGRVTKEGGVSRVEFEPGNGQ